MTPNKAIEIVDRLKHNVYSEEDKLRWINELEGLVKRQVFEWDEKYIEEIKKMYEDEKITEEKYNELINETKPYIYPDDMDKELAIPFPYDDCYTLFLESKIDYYNKEIGNYNNSAMMFEAQFLEYKKDYIRKHPVKE